MAQKLVSMYFNDDHEDKRKEREVLGDYLCDGWVVKSMIPVGAGVGHSTGSEYAQDALEGYVSGWALVLLEKP